ncbi:MAG TPA: hypothetical protein HPP83_12235, partial [Candidatus Hydrogenedentes bacterium]|nr:hypothetical protein [Candidatus Hydrogenedentota bacterium]
MTELKQTSAYSETDLPVAPERLRVVRNADGQYAAHWDGHQAVVTVCRCFPW